MNKLKVEGLCKKYGRKRVFNDLNATLSHNRFVVLLGANGAGKSTFLKMCAGLAPMDRGVVHLNDGCSRKDRTKASSYVSEESGFESFYSLEKLLVQQAVLYEQFDQKAATEMCKVVGLSLQAKWGRLSTGQRHLFALIVAILGPKRFIFIDEVMANLDTTKKEAMITILTDFLVEEDRMIVIATHAYEDVEMLADGVIFIQNGNAEVINDLDEWRFNNGKSLRDLFAKVGKS